ncbi:MAG: hypothetical protein CMI30_01095 [Opitutae bacterium]|nr:hypothetical protein [Opitutae bacterium]
MTKKPYILAFAICFACGVSFAQVPAPITPSPSPNPVAPVAPAPPPPASVAPLGPPTAANADPFDYSGIPDLNKTVGIIKLSDETALQVLKQIEIFTDRNILPAQNLPANLAINFDSRLPLTKGEALLALESLLSINGVAITRINDRFWKAALAAGLTKEVPLWLEGSPSSEPPSEKIYTTLFKLDYLPVKEVMTSLPANDFGSKSIKMVPFENANTLLVTDSMLNLQRIEKLILNLDKQVPVSEKILFIKTKHIDGKKILDRLQKMQKESLKRYLGANTSFDYEDATSQIIVVTHADNESLIREIIENLDQPIESKTITRIFHLHYSVSGDDPESTAKESGIYELLTAIIEGQRKAQDKKEQEGAKASATKSSAGSKTVKPATPKPGAPAAPATAPKATTQSTTSGDSSDDNLQFSEYLTIAQHARQNAILAYGTPKDIEIIGDLIMQLDQPLRQVDIEVIIAEVTLNNSDLRGIDIFRIAVDKEPDAVEFPNSVGLHNRTAGIFSVSGERTGFVLGGRYGNAYLDAVLDIAKSDSRVEVLSTPNIVASHNREATIMVTQGEPIVTGFANDQSSGFSSRTSVQYRDIGIELKVTPLIAVNGRIQLEIEQTVENIVARAATPGLEGQPIIGKRFAQSSVAVNDGEVIVLAGMQETKPEITTRKTPILGSLPVLKNLFTRKETTDTKRDLIFFIRPKVLEGSTSLEETIAPLNINDDLKEAIRTGDFFPDIEDDESTGKGGLGDSPDTPAVLPSLARPK